MTNNETNSRLIENQNKIANHKLNHSHRVEIFFWILIFSGVFGFLIKEIKTEITIESFFSNNLVLIAVTIFAAITIVLSRLVFAELPISLVVEATNYAIATIIDYPLEDQKNKITENANVFNEIKTILKGLSNKDLADTPEKILKSSIKSYSDACSKINSKSNAYLFIGCLIAFAGIFIPLYSNLLRVVDESTLSSISSITEILIVFFPRVSMLLLIEFIAFFFLKQYRVMQEDFKYFDKIKRQLVNELLFLFILERYKGQMDIINVYKERLNNELNVKLNSGETTEALETQKVINQDLDFLSKLNELVKSARGGNN